MWHHPAIPIVEKVVMIDMEPWSSKRARLASGINPVTPFDAKAEHEAAAGVVGCHDVVAVCGHHHFALYSSGKPHHAVLGETCAWHVPEYPGLAA